MTDASKPPMVNGVAIGRSIVPTLASRPLPNTWTSLGLSAKGRIHENACRNDARMLSLVSGICRSTRPAWRRGAACAVASTISSNGVMPAIGSFENCPSEYDTAPTRRPSI